MDGFNRSTFLEDVKRHSVKHEDTEVAEERGVNDKITRMCLRSEIDSQ